MTSCPTCGCEMRPLGRCTESRVSSRICERGTEACVVRHAMHCAICGTFVDGDGSDIVPILVDKAKACLSASDAFAKNPSMKTQIEAMQAVPSLRSCITKPERKGEGDE